MKYWWKPYDMPWEGGKRRFMWSGMDTQRCFTHRKVAKIILFAKILLQPSPFIYTKIKRASSNNSHFHAIDIFE